MVTLVELGAIFWVGVQIWHTIVLPRAMRGHQEEERATAQRARQRFERFFALPTLLVLLLANIGVLAGQGFGITGNAWTAAFAPTFLAGLASGSRFGTFWLMREIVIVLAIGVLALTLLFKRPVRLITRTLPWVNLLSGLALFLAISLSGHAAAVNTNLVFYAVMVDWLHLVAAALWVGGMLYIATIYLPVLRQTSVQQQAGSLLSVLPAFSPFAVAGVILMAGTGPLTATLHLMGWEEFITTAYGHALAVKILLVGGLLLTSAVHVFLVRPRLKAAWAKYAYAVRRLQAMPSTPVSGKVTPLAPQVTLDELTGPPSLTGVLPSSEASTGADVKATTSLARQVRFRETRLKKQTQFLTRILSFEPLLAIGVLLCVGLMNVFGGTLFPTAVAPPPPVRTQPFHTTTSTVDKELMVTLTVTPNRFGPNTFVVGVVDNRTGKPPAQIGVTLYTTMTDMDMGTQSIVLQPDDKGHFSGTGDLGMSGHWQIRIQVRTLDNRLHEATVHLVTP